jgi:hypothetical protein
MYCYPGLRKSPEEEPRPAGVVDVDMGDEYKVETFDS